MDESGVLAYGMRNPQYTRSGAGQPHAAFRHMLYESQERCEIVVLWRRLLPGHDIIVLGASTGGVEALANIVAALPGDLPAAVFVVLHLPSTSTSHLPRILSRSGPLKAVHPINGAQIEHGHIYVAPPNRHLLIERGHMQLTHGPRENHHRPAVDPLFRSAARAYGPRVVGVVLTGALNDGTAGLLAIKRRGGFAIAQEPAEAIAPGMPASACQYVQVDARLPLAQIPSLLVRLTSDPAPDETAFPLPNGLDLESRIAAMDPEIIDQGLRPGTISAFTCPECHGPLWEIQDGELLRYRCRVGHAYTGDSMLDGKSTELEESLWVALNTLEESASIAWRLCYDARRRNHLNLATRYEERARHAQQRVDLVRRVLESGALGGRGASEAADAGAGSDDESFDT